MDSSSQVKNCLAFSEELGKLKHVDRRGWVLRGIKGPECVAGHMYRMAVLAMTALDPIPGCDTNKVLKMCLVHDLPESRVGDITPHDKVPDDEKHKRERDAMKDIAGLLARDPRVALIQLYTEYEEHLCIEARVTKDLDRFDMVQQAFEYEKKVRMDPPNGHPLPDLSEFFHEENVLSRIENPQIKGWIKEIMDQRSVLFENSSRDHQIM